MLARLQSRPSRGVAFSSTLRAVGLMLAVLALAGCSGRSSFLAGGPTMGQLKTSVAHLEYENAQMKRDLAKLRHENRSMEDRLVQEEQDNGELAARLDDARNLLRDRGVEDGGRGARTLPAGQSNKKRRKPPVARIPGQFTPDTPASDQDDEETLGPPQASPKASFGSDQTGLRLDDDLDRQTYSYRAQRWTPIAERAPDQASQVR